MNQEQQEITMKVIFMSIRIDISILIMSKEHYYAKQ